MDKFEILLFAKAKEVVGNKTSIVVELPKGKNTTLHLISQLKTLHPEIIPILDISLLAVNQEYVERGRDIEINSKDEIAIIPPVSGG
ncbi:hypothetical protein DICPUDRAFT_31066 [Dictyostelium purpureum]|uniref:Molybdopterin synthase sulfur carrier subunit n=1 Tax=Dictyostelium purpureum TaxID=5786 RepID=F0ZGL6_DICPU|nr:uncharacterized protein DICPUDRAFT_31066 [Dictyostelium purpureum]EGC36926.1 hypothetical protein DICPUDRAFT_31066 [Dictyostelium purpureum]|eukprot:XP_003286569.1 hypothetical protein DICPUDRAFT_31066 [Dictyostelium purpureum]